MACDHVVGAARKAGFVKTSSRIVEHRKANTSHPFFGTVARACHERFVIAVNGDSCHLGARCQLFEQNIVSVSVQLFRGNVCQVAAKQQVVGLNGIDLRNQVSKLLGVEQRIYMNVAKEHGGKAFGVLAR